MRRHFKTPIKYILKHLGYEIKSLKTDFPVRRTKKRALQSLLQKLYPMRTDRELIRLGPKGDGGYLVPDDFVGIEACFSPGVSTVSGFEKDCADLGMKVFLADKSVEQPAVSHDLFYFTQKYVGATTNDDFMRVDDWVTLSLPESQKDFMLQIDIEGYEYETFLAMPDSMMRRCRIIIAEFHQLDQLWSKSFFLLASRVFEKILQTHTCIHIHPNNNSSPSIRNGVALPRAAEFTFLRNDRICDSSYTSTFPHPLDCDNTDKPHFPLPNCWYSNR